MDATHRYQVAVVGGGIVGGSMAGALARAGVRTVLLEPSFEAPVNADGRPLALSAGSRNILDALGIWARLAGDYTPIEHIHVSQRGRFGAARLHAHELGAPALGYVTTTAAVHRALSDWLGECPSLNTLAARATDYSVAARTAHLATDNPDQSEIQADLLVAADGAGSPLRERAGITTRHHDYRQHALTGEIWPARPRAATAFERFTPDGPIALLPMSARHYGLVWTVPSANVADLTALDDAGFATALERSFGLRLGRINRIAGRGAYPLSLTHAAHPVAERLVAIGNAAQTLHPVAGQGLNLGLRDVAGLAECIVDAIRAGADPGAGDRLAAYAQARASDRDGIVRLTDGLAKLFATDLPPLPELRGAGLALMNNLMPIKRRFARHTMGLAGRQPRLARGLAL